VNESKIQNLKPKIYLGVDGGQSHTEAVVADEGGNLLGRGTGGASNHAEHPGGRERLRDAILRSVGAAVKDAETRRRGDAEISSGSVDFARLLASLTFASAHFGMTGGADFKEEIIGEIIRAEHFTVGHDAPTALFGATAGTPGIVVISGTGAVVYGENESGETAQIGGLGYLFSDEGSGFWLAAQTVRLAIKEQDGLIAPTGLEKLVLGFFGRKKIREVTNDFYFAKISRDDLARFARAAADAAAAGNVTIQNQIESGARVLVQSVGSAARRLNFAGDFPVAAVGGMFRGALLKKHFTESLKRNIPGAIFTEPRFNPATGALLVAYRQANVIIDDALLTNLEKSTTK